MNNNCATCLEEKLRKSETNREELDRDHGITPLHRACAEGKLPLVILLLEAGAAIEARVTGETYTDYTPLFLAIVNEHVPIIIVLLQQGALLETDSLNALDIAQENNIDLAALITKHAPHHYTLPEALQKTSEGNSLPVQHAPAVIRKN